MFRVWKEAKSQHWRAQYFDGHGNDRKYTLTFGKDTPRETVVAETMPDAAHYYVLFLHRDQNLWLRLESRNYDLKRMYQRVSLFHEYYTIEEFAFDLRELGITPVEPKKAVNRRQREKRSYKRLTKRNQKYTFKGRELTLKEWSAVSKIPYKALQMRIARGWPMDKALNTPIINKETTGRMGAERRWSHK
ncbi:MAG: hypothetical protein AAFX93_19500 [Verrucomicrobiota bacterium]